MKKNLLIREDEIIKLVNEFYKKPGEFISILLKKYKNYPNKDLLFFKIGGVLKKSINSDFSIECFKKSLYYLKDSKNIQLEIECYGNIGMLYGKLGKHIKALRNFHHCLRISNKINHKRSITQSSVKIGIGYYNIERYKVASEYLEHSLKLINELGDNSLNFLRSECYRFLGLIDKHHGNYQRAIHFQEKALNIITELNNRIEEANTYLNLGSIYYDIGNQNENILFQKKALRIFKESGNKKEQANCYNNLGNAFMDLGKPLKSLYYHKKTLNIKEKIEDKKGLADSYNNIGLLNLSLKRYDNVIYYNTKSLKIYREIGSKSGEAKSLGGISIANIELKEINNAENNLIKALDLFNEIGLIDGIISSRLNLARLYYEELNKIELAYKNCKIGLELFEKIFFELFEEQHEFSLIASIKDPYLLMISICIDMEKKEEALEYVERSKSKSFLKLLSLSDIKPRIELNQKNIELIRKEKILLEKIKKLKGRKINKANLELDYELVKKLKSELKIIYKEIEKKDPEYVLFREGKAVDTDKIKKFVMSLKENILFIEYYLGKDCFYIFLIFKENNDIKIDVKKIQKRWSEIYNFLNNIYLKELNEYREGKKVKNEWQSSGEFLIKTIFKYIERSDMICFIPHNILHYLPFHALIHRGQPIICFKPIFYSPSFSVLFFCKRRKNIKLNNGRFFGIDFVDEAEELSEIFNSTPVLNQNATIENVNRLSRKSDILHFACHGIFNHKNPLYSGIKLFDELLTVNYILNNLNLNAELVTLSACETGINKIYKGDELVGLTRAFLYVGASSVIVSLWKVFDRPTKDLMRIFYENLKKGKHKVESLQIAQIEIMRKKPDFYHWAPFVLIGKW